MKDIVDLLLAAAKNRHVAACRNGGLTFYTVTETPFSPYSCSISISLNITSMTGFYIRTIIKEPEKAHGLQVQVGLVGSGTGG